ncbi:uncharacterized [Tachysurus ichikawai]
MTGVALQSRKPCRVKRSNSTTHMIDTYSQPTPAVPEGGTSSSTASTTTVSQQEQSAIKCICTGREVNKMLPYNKTVL